MAFEVLDEHEQGELVRKWLRANTFSILVGIGIGLLLIFGYQQWQARTAQTRGEAAMHFESFVEAVDAERHDDAKRIAQTLREEFAKSPYAVFASLSEADSAVSKGDLAAAGAALEQAAQLASDPTVKSLIAIRQARVKLALDDADGALKLLDGVKKTDYPALAGELRGDVLAKLGRGEDARAAYTEALTHLDMQSPNRSFVEMKLGNLSAPAVEKQPS